MLGSNRIERAVGKRQSLCIADFEETSFYQQSSGRLCGDERFAQIYSADMPCRADSFGEGECISSDAAADPRAFMPVSRCKA
jgi:hypothetical protein